MKSGRTPREKGRKLRKKEGGRKGRESNKVAKEGSQGRKEAKVRMIYVPHHPLWHLGAVGN